MADIVDHSGAGVGSIHRHFGGKKELFLAIFERLWGPRRCRPITDATIEWIDRLTSYALRAASSSSAMTILRPETLTRRVPRRR